MARRDDALSARITRSFPLIASDGRFVRAGSALVRRGRELLAIQDDAWQVWRIEPRQRSLRSLNLKGRGAPRPKKKKPDFEAAFAAPDGSVWILGSGATEKRRRIAQLSRAGVVRIRDAAPLYRALERALGMPPNIEGAVPAGEQLRLFHRGPGRARQANAMLDVPVAVLTGAPARVSAVTPCDLGTVQGLHLGFTDAVALGPQQILYLAVAEDTRDSIADGPVAGAAVGIIEGGSARWTLLREADGRPSTRKVEGVVLDSDTRGGWLLTDPDDPTRPAELCRFELAATRAGSRPRR